jgi:hypothetical protein
VITQLTQWQLAILEKLVRDEIARARKSGQPLDLLNDLAALGDTLVRADVLHAETFHRQQRNAALSRRPETLPDSL